MFFFSTIRFDHNLSKSKSRKYKIENRHYCCENLHGSYQLLTFLFYETTISDLESRLSFRGIVSLSIIHEGPEDADVEEKSDKT